eukprot:6192006-Pleurochrysis_carterae.AAC.5
MGSQLSLIGPRGIPHAIKGWLYLSDTQQISHYGRSMPSSTRPCIDWLHANEEPREKYTVSYTAKCVMLCLPQHLKRP